MKLKNSSVLIVAAHPDDEVLGCGGTIKKLTKSGNKVNIIFISDGVSSRKMSKKNYLVEFQKKTLKKKILKNKFEIPFSTIKKIPIKHKDIFMNFKN